MSKHHSIRFAVSTAALLFSAADARAQGRVHKVDPRNASAFASIDAAIAAAAPGDIIVVAAKPQIPSVVWSTLYPPIRIDKSLSITSESGHDVRCWSAEITGLGTQDGVVIRGIHFERPTLLVGFGMPTLAVDNCRGHVFLEDCSFQPASPLAVAVGTTFPAIDIQGPTSGPRGSVTLVRCSVRGVGGANNPRAVGQQLPAPGIRATNTDLALWDSDVAGGRGASSYPQLRLPAGDGAAAMVFDGYAFLSASVLRGGDGGNATTGTCSTGGNGGAGIELAQASTLLESLASTIAGGNGGAGCPSGTAGAAEVIGTATRVHLAGASTAIEVSSPHRAGQTAVLTHTGVQGGAYVAFAGSAPSLLWTTPFGLLGVRSLSGPGSTQPIYAGAYGAGGQTVLPALLPLTGQDGAVFLLQTAAFVPPSHLMNSAPTALFLLAPHL